MKRDYFLLIFYSICLFISSTQIGMTFNIFIVIMWMFYLIGDVASKKPKKKNKDDKATEYLISDICPKNKGTYEVKLKAIWQEEGRYMKNINETIELPRGRVKKNKSIWYEDRVLIYKKGEKIKVVYILTKKLKKRSKRWQRYFPVK